MNDMDLAGWQPIENAPKDNKRPLWLARFNPDTAELVDIDFGASWESESESWELPTVYYFWASAYGRIEEPTHWAYQDQGPPPSVESVATANTVAELGEARKAWRDKATAESQLARLRGYRGRPTPGMKDDMNSWSRLLSEADATLRRVLGGAR